MQKFILRERKSISVFRVFFFFLSSFFHILQQRARFFLFFWMQESIKLVQSAKFSIIMHSTHFAFAFLDTLSNAYEFRKYIYLSAIVCRMCILVVAMKCVAVQQYLVGYTAKNIDFLMPECKRQTIPFESREKLR